MAIEKAVTIEGEKTVQNIFDKVKSVFEEPAPLLHEIGYGLKARIIDRTLEGRGPQGVPYPTQYSKAYKKFREQQGLPVDHVYLKWYGGMLASMIHEVASSIIDQNDTLRIYFADMVGQPYQLKETRTATGQIKRARSVPQKLTEAEKAAALFQKYPFFLLDDDDILFTQRVIVEHIAKVLEHYGGTEPAGTDN